MEGQEDLVSRLVTPVTHIVATLVAPLFTYLLTSPDPPSRVRGCRISPNPRKPFELSPKYHPFIRPITVPYTIPHITPFEEVRLYLICTLGEALWKMMHASGFLLRNLIQATIIRTYKKSVSSFWWLSLDSLTATHALAQQWNFSTGFLPKYLVLDALTWRVRGT